MSTPRTDRLACIDWFRRGDLEEIFTELRALETELQQAQAALAEETASFKSFHRNLCLRFEYGHDDKDWKRDQASLEEWIAKRLAAVTLEREQEKAHLTAKLDEVVAEKRDVVELRRSLDDRNGLIHEMRSMLRLAGFPERVKSGEDEYGNEYFIPVRVEVQLKDALAQLAACQSREAKALEDLNQVIDQPRILMADWVNLNADRDQLQTQVGALRTLLEEVRAFIAEGPPSEPDTYRLNYQEEEKARNRHQDECAAYHAKEDSLLPRLDAALAQPTAAPDSAKDGVADYLGTVPTEPAKDGQ